MSRLDAIFKELRQSNSSGLMPFLTGGFPDLEMLLVVGEGPDVRLSRWLSTR